MLDCLLTEEVSAEIDDNSLEAVFIFCLVWSVGAAVIQKPGVQDRDRFDNFVKRTAEFMTYEGEGLTDTQLPKDSLYEYCFDLKRSKWYTWKSMVTALEVKDDAKFATILVPTVDTVRSAWLLDTFSAAGKPVLFVGDSGTAKTVTINKYLGGPRPGEERGAKHELLIAHHVDGRPERARGIGGEAHQGYVWTRDGQANAPVL